MFRNVNTRDLACMALRLSLGVIFVVHGLDKISHNWGTDWEPEVGTAPNLALAWGELVGGGALLLGLLTRVTAAGFGFVMCCALYVVGSVKGFQGESERVIRGFDYMRVGSEFPFALLFQCIALMLLGGGAYSVDHYLRRRTAQPAKGDPAVGAPHMDAAASPAETSPR
jgi:putative oxidoreductase